MSEIKLTSSSSVMIISYAVKVSAQADHYCVRGGRRGKVATYDNYRCFYDFQQGSSRITKKVRLGRALSTSPVGYAGGLNEALQIFKNLKDC